MDHCAIEAHQWHCRMCWEVATDEHITTDTHKHMASTWQYSYPTANRAGLVHQWPTDDPQWPTDEPASHPRFTAGKQRSVCFPPPVCRIEAKEVCVPPMFCRREATRECRAKSCMEEPLPDIWPCNDPTNQRKHKGRFNTAKYSSNWSVSAASMQIYGRMSTQNARRA